MKEVFKEIPKPAASNLPLRLHSLRSGGRSVAANDSMSGRCFVFLPLGTARQRRQSIDLRPSDTKEIPKIYIQIYTLLKK